MALVLWLRTDAAASFPTGGEALLWSQRRQVKRAPPTALLLDSFTIRQLTAIPVFHFWF